MVKFLSMFPIMGYEVNVHEKLNYITQDGFKLQVRNDFIADCLVQNLLNHCQKTL